MKLSRIERLMLVNQYRILECIDPDQTDFYKRAQDAFQHGFESAYETFAGSISPNAFTEAACEEVMNILLMFDSLAYAYRRLSDNSGIDDRAIEFSGFDGNNEVEQLSYWQYLFNDGRFRELGEPCNSHMPTLERYRRMLNAYKQGNQGINLTKEDIQRVIEAGQLRRE